MTKMLAKGFSVVFHPIFILPYLFFFCWISCTHLFDLIDDMALVQLIVYFIVSAVVLPLVGIVLLKKLELVKTNEMESRYERIGPLIITGMLYAWLSVNFYRSNGNVPDPITLVTIGATLALFIAFFLNNFFKVSLHAVGIGGLIMGSIIMAMNWSYGYVMWFGGSSLHIIALVILILVLSGLVLSSRMYLGAHNLSQIYHGFVVGVLGQVIALRIIL